MGALSDIIPSPPFVHTIPKLYCILPPPPMFYLPPTTSSYPTAATTSIATTATAITNPNLTTIIDAKGGSRKNTCL